MEKFLARYGSLVTGVLSGFDRLAFRGSLLALIREGGMYAFLQRAGVLLLDFKDFVLATSKRLERASLAEAEKRQRPIRYLQASSTDKEALARRLLADHPIDEGLICVLRVVEPCMSFEYHRAQEPQGARSEAATAQVPPSLPLLPPPALRLHQRPPADLVSL